MCSTQLYIRVHDGMYSTPQKLYHENIELTETNAENIKMN